MSGGYQGLNGTEMKRQAWDRITTILNNMRVLGTNPRTSEQWKRVWMDLVINAKKRNSAKKRDFVQTGGGPAKVPPLPSLQLRILELVSTQAHGVSKEPKGTITRSRRTPVNARSEIAKFFDKSPVAGPSRERTAERSSTSSETSTSSKSQEPNLQDQSSESNRIQEPKFLQQRQLSQDEQSQLQKQPSIPVSLPPESSVLHHGPAEAARHTSNWEMEKTTLLQNLARKDEQLKMKNQEINRLAEENKFLKNEFVAMRTMAHDLINKMK